MQPVLLFADAPVSPLSEPMQRLAESQNFDVHRVTGAEELCLELTICRPDAVLISFPALLSWGGQFFKLLRTLNSEAVVIVLNRLHHGHLSFRAFSGTPLGETSLDLVRDVMRAIDPESSCCLPMATDRARFGFQIPSNVDQLTSVVDFIESFAAYRSPLTNQECLALRMAVSEALFNAILHGNLEVPSSLKEQDDDAFYRLARLRAAQLPYAERQVTISVEANLLEFRCTISDEGSGFDRRKLGDPRDPENLCKPSGRGILMMQSAMDNVTWNAQGNTVEMHKQFDHVGQQTDRIVRRTSVRDSEFAPV